MEVLLAKKIFPLILSTQSKDNSFSHVSLLSWKTKYYGLTDLKFYDSFWQWKEGTKFIRGNTLYSVLFVHIASDWTWQSGLEGTSEYCLVQRLLKQGHKEKFTQNCVHATFGRENLQPQKCFLTFRGSLLYSSLYPLPLVQGINRRACLCSKIFL